MFSIVTETRNAYFEGNHTHKETPKMCSNMVFIRPMNQVLYALIQGEGTMILSVKLNSLSQYDIVYILENDIKVDNVKTKKYLKLLLH